MADSAPSPDSSSSSEGTSDGSPPSPPSTNEGSSPPVSEPSPPSNSPPSPPVSSSDPSSSPPSGSPTPNTPPPESPPSGNSSSPPPSNSGSSPPSPPSESESSSSPPPSQTSDPPPNDPDQSFAPPSNSPPSSENSPPSPPLSPPIVSSPAPTTSQSSPSPPGTVPSGSSSPPTSTNPFPGDSPPEISTPNPVPPTQTTPSDPLTPTPPASRTSNRIPELSPPSTRSRSSSSSHSSTKHSSDSNDNSGYAIGVTVAGVLIIAFIALVFVMNKRKKKRAEVFPDFYRPNPLNFSGKSDGYYYRQAGVIGNSSSHSDSYYATKPPPSPSTIGNSFGGSYRGGHGFHSGPPENGGIGNSKSWFSYEELMDITNGFARQNVLGEGGFGCVYKGKLPDGREVAVKQLKAGSGQGEREFRAEVEIISRVHHKHLVSLVGYCIAEHHRLLVYEFVPNNTLEYHLHGKENPVMEWPKRMKIAIGAARGLAYLHEDCHPRIIHRDIKTANILLDDSFEAQVADFGLAKLSNDTHTHVSTRVMGTFGYMAPEYASSGKLTDRSDVFSFGVVLLELVTGRKPVDASQPLGDESLVEWARPVLIRALDTGNFDELVDPRLENVYVVGEMFRMVEAAAACVRHSAPKRPRMVQVVRALDTEGDMSDLTNGVKFGQSTVFESGQYSNDIQRFRRMAFGSNDYSSDYGHSGEYDTRSTSSYSGEYQHSRDAPHRMPNQWRPGDTTSSEYTSGNESETRAMNRPPSENGGSRGYNGR